MVSSAHYSGFLRIAFLAFLTAVVFLIFPHRALSQSSEVSAYGIDTVAGFETILKASGFPPGEIITFEVKKPDQTLLSFETEMRDSGIAQVSFSDLHTRSAGLYRVRALGRDRETSWSSFRVYPGTVSPFHSKIFLRERSAFADGNDSAIVIVHLTDEFGNSLEDEEVKLLSDRRDDIITPFLDFDEKELWYEFVTNREGNVAFEIRSKEIGIANLSVLHRASSEVLDQKVKVAFHRGSNISKAIGGDLRQRFLALSDGKATSLKITNTPREVRVGENFNAQVSAVQDNQNIVPDYRGTIHFSSPTDLNASLPSDYAFTSRDNGKHTFSLAFSFQEEGEQTLVVTDIDDPTIRGEKKIRVSARTETNREDSTIEITKPMPGTYSKRKQEISGETEPNASVHIFDNGQQIGTVKANSSGIFTFSTPPLSDGQHTLYAENNGVQSNDVIITIDATPGKIASFTLNPERAAPKSEVLVTLQSDPDLDEVTVIIADIIVELTRDSDDPEIYKGKITAPEKDGVYPLDVVLTDKLGNESSFIEVGRLTVDKTIPPPQREPPQITFDVPSRVTGVRATPGNGFITLQWEAATDDTGIAFYRIYYGIDRKNLTKVTQTPDARRAWGVTGLQNGVQYFFQVAGVDTEGNEADQRSALVAAIPDENARGVLPPSDTVYDVSPPPYIAEDGPELFPLALASFVVAFILRKRHTRMKS